ncbi:hypothetical protein, partial [Citrobacter youngae]|uniref:hypothetical protein n=1 Tax=Citrobacter youngae TaxID=133448 RepID=UPI003D7F1369
MQVCQGLLNQLEAKGVGCTDCIITSDEMWCHHHEPESKQQSIVSQCVNSPSKKFKSQSSAGKVMCTVFWDRRGVILLDFLECGLTIDSDHYIMTLTDPKACTSRIRSEMMRTFLLQHGNARLQSSFKTG